MQLFAEHHELMAAKESRRVVKQYNRLARVLVEYEVHTLDKSTLYCPVQKELQAVPVPSCYSRFSRLLVVIQLPFASPD